MKLKVIINEFNRKLQSKYLFLESDETSILNRVTLAYAHEEHVKNLLRTS